jgi:hypothetical protein
MDIAVLQAFVKYACLGEDTPEDYHPTRAAVHELFPGLEKRAWSWHGFKEGLQDEGIPLAGATIGAGLGGLRGAALGYAVGGGASMLRSKLRGEQPSMGRKLLAASALGYGAGGLTHAGLEHLTHGARAGSIAQKLFHPLNQNKGTFVSRLAEEALPAAGATLATGYTMAKAKPGEHE